MTDCDEVEPSVLDKWHLVYLGHLTQPKRGECLQWLDQMPGGKYYWTLSFNVWFELEEDRLITALTWK